MWPLNIDQTIDNFSYVNTFFSAEITRKKNRLFKLGYLLHDREEHPDRSIVGMVGYICFARYNGDTLQPR